MKHNLLQGLSPTNCGGVGWSGWEKAHLLRHAVQVRHGLAHANRRSHVPDKHVVRCSQERGAEEQGAGSRGAEKQGAEVKHPLATHPPLPPPLVRPLEAVRLLRLVQTLEGLPERALISVGDLEVACCEGRGGMECTKW
jgi:hypothetical protein